MNQKIIKKSLVTIACLSFVLCLYSGKAIARERYEEKFEKTESLARDGKVFLSNISGRIEVKTWAEEKVKIDALKVSEASALSRAQENAKIVLIEVKKEANTLRIETKYPEHRERESINVSVNYQLWIPDKAFVDLDSVSGEVTAEGIGGSARVNTVSGNIKLENVEKGVDCNSTSGDLVLKNVKGDVDANTTSGKISASQIIGSIHAVSVSGDIELSDVSEAKVIKASSVSGSIRYQGKIMPEGKYSLKTMSGQIVLDLPSDSSFELEADTFSGHIDSDFPIEISGKIVPREFPREFHAVVNKGGGYITLSSFSGSIGIKCGRLNIKKK
jgi:DUF4097 and DUF4098 domain-containing protein YvlB